MESGSWCSQDGSGEHSPLTPLLKELARGDSRITVLSHERQLRIAENTNEAIWAAAGNLLVFGDHDDLFAPDALYECVKTLNEKPGTELIYSDEDKVDGSGKRYFQPHFKPDYSPELLTSMNYFCHLVAVTRRLQKPGGGFWTPPMTGPRIMITCFGCAEAAGEGKTRPHPKDPVSLAVSQRFHGRGSKEQGVCLRGRAGRAIQAHYQPAGNSGPG